MSVEQLSQLLLINCYLSNAIYQLLKKAIGDNRSTINHSTPNLNGDRTLEKLPLKVVDLFRSIYRTQFSVFVLIVLVAGCGPKGPPTAAVDGVVTYEGKPVQYARVMFFPQNVPTGMTGYAQTDAEGKFAKVLTGGTTEGVVVGSHFVTVTEGWPPDKEVPMDASGMQKSPPRGPWTQKYRDSTNPAIKVEVVAGQNNHFDFEISK